MRPSEDIFHAVASPGSWVNEPSLKRTRVSYTLESTRIELMSVSWPGSIEVGSATSPTTRVLAAACASRVPTPTTAVISSTIASVVRHPLIGSPPLREPA